MHRWKTTISIPTSFVALTLFNINTIHTHIHTYMHTYTRIQTYRQTDKTDRQTYRHTYIHTLTYIHICMPAYLPACLPTYLPTCLPMIEVSSPDSNGCDPPPQHTHTLHTHSLTHTIRGERHTRTRLEVSAPQPPPLHEVGPPFPHLYHSNCLFQMSLWSPKTIAQKLHQLLCGQAPATTCLHILRSEKLKIN